MLESCCKICLWHGIDSEIAGSNIASFSSNSLSIRKLDEERDSFMLVHVNLNIQAHMYFAYFGQEVIGSFGREHSSMGFLRQSGFKWWSCFSWFNVFVNQVVA